MSPFLDSTKKRIFSTISNSLDDDDGYVLIKKKFVCYNGFIYKKEDEQWMIDDNKEEIEFIKEFLGNKIKG